MKTFKQIISESIGSGGLEYEGRVRESVSAALKAGKFKNLTLKPDDAGGFANNVVDMYLNLNGNDIAVEIKMDRNAQMGGPSVKISPDGKYSLSGAGAELPETVQLKMINAAKSMEGGIRAWIQSQRDLVADMDDEDPVKKLVMSNPDLAMPFGSTKEIWSNLQGKGMLKPLNVAFTEESGFIHDWYARKKCNYIQIGKAGLFFMKDDPLGLKSIGVPQLNGEIQVRCRMTRSGGGGTAAIPTKRSGQIRCIAGLKTKNTSPLSLDKPEDALKVFNHIIGRGE